MPVKITFIQWQENGHIMLEAGLGTYMISDEPVVNDVNWRGYKGKTAWNCDYWNFTEKEIAWLKTFNWSKA